MSTVISSATTTAPAPARAWEQFRVLLETQRGDCVQQRALALAEAATSVPDPVTVTRAARMLVTIAEIDNALDRIAAGTYGMCVHCGVAIPLERLELRPFAAGCVACQQSAR